MSKRFKIGLDLITIEDTSKEYGALNQDEVVDELNRLNEENEQLKKECYGNLDGLNYYQEQNGHLSSKISDLECENEQLKKEIEELNQALIHSAFDR